MYTLIMAVLTPLAVLLTTLHYIGKKAIANGEYDKRGRRIKHQPSSSGDFSGQPEQNMPAMATKSTLGEEVQLPGPGAYLPATKVADAPTDDMKFERQVGQMIDQAIAYAYAQGMADAQPKKIRPGCTALAWDGSAWQQCDGTLNRTDGQHTCGKIGVK